MSAYRGVGGYRRRENDERHFGGPPPDLTRGPWRHGPVPKCGHCFTVMVQDRPPGRHMHCVNDKCKQHGIDFYK